MKKTVKMQILGMKGDNRNLVLSKDLVIPNAIDGHFETDDETAEMLLSKFNLKDEPRGIAVEGDPDYSAPAPVAKEVKADNVAELKDDLLMANAKLKLREEEIEELKEKLDKSAPLSRDRSVAKLKDENDKLKEENDKLVTANIEMSDKIKDLENKVNKLAESGTDKS